TAGFFGLGVVIAPWAAASGWLRLTPEGFETRSLGRREFIRWEEVNGGFFVFWMHHNDFVGYQLAPEIEHQRRMRGINRALTGIECMLPDTYGLRADRLCALMNQWWAAPDGATRAALPTRVR
ncbi:MAG TPA: hypothetical protein VEI97_17500, partial [bacterium]|nr:hypothetical protein [bacterium]